MNAHYLIRPFTCPLRQKAGTAAFTLTELLVVVLVLALLIAVRLPALCRTNVSVKLIQCMSNCRQIGVAAALYRNDNTDAFPFGNRVTGPGTGPGTVVDPTGWPMQLLHYLGGYHNVQPAVYRCPSEKSIADNWVLQLHYQANRQLVSDLDFTVQPIRGAAVRNPAIYWLFMEKSPSDFANVRPGGLANPILYGWNIAPGWASYRRHSGGLTATAADGHVEWLRMPPYQPGQVAPPNFLELGDCANGQNPGSTWQDTGSYPPVKLYCRYSTQGF